MDRRRCALHVEGTCLAGREDILVLAILSSRCRCRCDSSKADVRSTRLADVLIRPQEETEKRTVWDWVSDPLTIGVASTGPLNKWIDTADGKPNWSWVGPVVVNPTRGYLIGNPRLFIDRGITGTSFLRPWTSEWNWPGCWWEYRAKIIRLYHNGSPLRISSVSKFPSCGHTGPAPSKFLARSS